MNGPGQFNTDFSLGKTTTVGGIREKAALAFAWSFTTLSTTLNSPTPEPLSESQISVLLPDVSRASPDSIRPEVSVLDVARVVSDPNSFFSMSASNFTVILLGAIKHPSISYGQQRRGAHHRRARSCRQRS